MVQFLFYLTAFLAVLSVVIVVHEGGHFFMARMCGVKVEEFAFGFGRELWGWTSRRSGTRYKICLYPLGGYVKMLGDSDAASSSSVEVAAEDQEHAFATQPVWKRFAIVFAGPFMNYVFAVAALAAFFMTVGLYVFPPKLAEVIKDGPAAVAGIEAGDLITAVNGTPIVDFAELKNIIVLSYKEDVVITVERGGQKLDFVVRPEMQDGTPLIGVVAVSAAAELTHDRLGPIAAISRAVKDTYTVTAGTLKYVKQIIFAGRSAKEMRGPLGIAEASGDAAKGGALSLILFIVQVSIAVGLINLFPIPMMDGGHLLLYLIEAMRGKALSAKVQSVIMKIGFLFIMALFGYTMLNDIPRIWERLWS